MPAAEGQPQKASSRAKTPQAADSPAAPVKKQRTSAARACLNDLYTFDSFVVYEDSRFAYQAGLSVAQSERALFNPLFLYGKSGVGKTHLLQAIGHEVLHQDSSTNVVYVTGEQFANEFIDASRTQNGQSFTKLRRKYRKADVLLVDDVQFISGKEKTVEEFLHTFDELFHAHKTIVICADAAACDISNLDPRLAARLESGLTVELNLPDDNARLEILRSKRDRAGMNVSDEILEFLASRIQKSVRRLEGALLRVATFTSLSGDMPDIAKIEQLLRDILREETSRILTVDSIQKRVADFYELKVSDLTGKRRPNSIAFPRQIAMYLSRRLTERSLKDIGQAFGGRDHGTVIHANKLVASRMEEDVRVRDIVQRLEEELRD
jgi:chromosomal replication initiator protein